MTIQASIDACRQRAFELKASQPHLIHAKRLDLAAQEFGYAHYTALTNLRTEHGPNYVPDDSASLMSIADVRAVFLKVPDLTRYGLGVTPESKQGRSYREAVLDGQQQLVDNIDECSRAMLFLRMMDKRKTINRRAGSSYGLKHEAEFVNERLSSRQRNPYVSNGALICAAIHLGFNFKDLGNPNPRFNISSKSDYYEWRDLTNEYNSSYLTVKAKARLNELNKKYDLVLVV